MVESAIGAWRDEPETGLVGHVHDADASHRPRVYGPGAARSLS
jgi:hypothetical protein